MTAMEQLLHQIDQLSLEERATLRKRLYGERGGAAADGQNGATLPTSAATGFGSRLWGLFAQDADALDSMIDSIYEARQNR